MMLCGWVCVNILGTLRARVCKHSRKCVCKKSKHSRKCVCVKKSKHSGSDDDYKEEDAEKNFRPRTRPISWWCCYKHLPADSLDVFLMAAKSAKREEEKGEGVDSGNSINSALIDNTLSWLSHSLPSRERLQN